MTHRKTIKKSHIDCMDLLIIVCLFLISFLIYYSFRSPPVPTSGDELRAFYGAHQLLSDANVNFWNELNNKYNTGGFQFERTFTVLTSFGEAYPTTTAGSLLFYSLFIYIFSSNIFYMLSPIFASFGIIIMYLLLKNDSNSKFIGIIGGLTLFSLPVYVNWALIPIDTIPTAIIFLISVYLLFKSDDNWRHILMSGFVLSIAILMRHTYIFSIIPYVIYISLINGGNKFKSLLSFFIPIVFSLFMLTIVNKLLFNNPFFVSNFYQNNYPADPGLYGINLEAHVLHGTYLSILPSIYKFLHGSHTLYFPLLFFALIGLIHLAKRNKKQFLFIFVFSMINLIYFGCISSQDYYSLQDINLQSSFIRYLIPVYILLIIPFSHFIDTIHKQIRGHKQKILFATILAMYLISSVAYPIYLGGSAGTTYLLEYKPKVIAYKEILNGTLPSDAVILASSIVEESFVYPNINNIFYYPGIPPEYRYEETTRVVNSLLQDNRRVFFMKSDMPYLIEDDNMFLILNENFIMDEMPETRFERMKSIFYEIKLNGNQ